MGHWVRLQGLGQLQYNAARLALLSKSGTDPAQLFQLTVESTHMDLHPKFESDAPVVFLDGFSQLLHENEDLFVVPTGISPTRDHDHRIPLLLGTNPVNIKPYRYPQAV